MKLLSRFAVASLISLAACGTLTNVEVTPLGKAPHPMKERAIESVQVFTAAAPAGAVDVFLINVSGGEKSERAAAVKEQAAKLGCDGVVVKDEETRAVGGDGATGQLNDHREMVTAHARGVCVVLAEGGAAASAGGGAPSTAGM